MVLNLRPGRHRYTYELMSAVWQFSTVAVMQFKDSFGTKRPADRSPLVQPVLLTPGHGAYPAGHATQNFFVVHVLKKLLKVAAGDDLATQLTRLAQRIADNRVVAGLHFPDDNAAGKTLGNALGAYFCAKCDAQGVQPADYSALQWLWEQASGEWS
jgi:hypothetical protein